MTAILQPKNFQYPDFKPLSEQELVSREKEMAERDKKEREEAGLAKYLKCGIGKRFRDATIDNFEARNGNDAFVKGEVVKYIEVARSGSITDLWLCGKSGTGKTHLACSIARELCCMFLDVVYVNSYYLKDEYESKKAYNTGETRQEFAVRYGKYDFLIIDEVGRFQDHELDCLFAIINERYERGNPTVLISNMRKQELGKYLGNALVDRFSETCRTIEFLGESYRETLRKDDSSV